MYLTTPIPYTYQYNLDFIDNNFSSSLIYNVLLKDQITVWTYVYFYVGFIIGLTIVLYGLYIYSERQKSTDHFFSQKFNNISWIKKYRYSFPKMTLPLLFKNKSLDQNNQLQVKPLPVQPTVKMRPKKIRRKKK
jgi:hypothetical protein